MYKEMIEILKNVKANIPNDIEVDLLKGRIIDSFDVAHIAAILEEYYHIEFNAEDIIPENFNSVRSIAELVESYRKEVNE